MGQLGSRQIWAVAAKPTQSHRTQQATDSVCAAISKGYIKIIHIYMKRETNPMKQSSSNSRPGPLNGDSSNILAMGEGDWNHRSTATRQKGRQTRAEIEIHKKGVWSQGICQRRLLGFPGRPERIAWWSETSFTSRVLAIGTYVGTRYCIVSKTKFWPALVESA